MKLRKEEETKLLYYKIGFVSIALLGCFLFCVLRKQKQHFTEDYEISRKRKASFREKITRNPIQSFVLLLLGCFGLALLWTYRHLLIGNSNPPTPEVIPSPTVGADKARCYGHKADYDIHTDSYKGTI